MSALFTAVSGIGSYQTRLDVIGHNLANLNTPGFKAERADFSDLFSQTLRPAMAPSGAGVGGINPVQIGLGVQVAGIKTLQTQGVLQVTSQPTDLAVQGNGFFVLTDGSNMFYTRAGGFVLDANGDLVMPATGYKVVAVGPAPQLGETVATVSIPLGSILNAQATTEATLTGNLDAIATTGDVVNATMRIYDSLGVAHDVALTFTKTATARTWDWDATLNSTSVGSGTITFDTSGAFDAAGSTVPPLNITAAVLGTGAAGMSVTLDMTALTQTRASSSVTESAQDGFSSGLLESFNISQDGTVTGVYSNGRTQTLAQIALAGFQNPSGLVRLGDNLYQESTNSGLPQVGAPLTGGLGSIVSGALEGSNVDLASTFADMLVTQRGFQANSRVITTADQLIQDLLNLGR